MKYDLVYCDPPWFYNSRVYETRGGEHKPRFGGGASNHYNLMKDKELLEMKDFINQISNDNCIMFMWATPPRLDFAIKLMEERGFNYKTIAFNWVKVNKDGTYRVNPGYYTASNSEIVILGIKGKNQGRFKPSKVMIQQIVAEHIREHSRKPDTVRERIEEMYPNLSKIELFARETKPGWSVRGNQTELFNDKESVLFI